MADDRAPTRPGEPEPRGDEADETRSTLRRRRRLGWWLTLAAAAAATVLLTFYVREYVANASVRAYLATMPPPTAADRVLVVAPHPDDETLGAGGYLAATVHAGGRVRVVVVTSGDGFRRDAIAYFHTLRPTRADFLRLGDVRRAESRAALGVLGVGPERVTFLGFPDGGTRALWEGHFTAQHPYHDPYTGVDRVPYRDAYRPGAPYDGAELERELSAVIRSFRPTVVFLPDPNDFNPDHQAVGEFTMMALARLGELDGGGPRLFFYVVHHGEWPTPFGDHPGAFLVPPSDLYRAEHSWLAFPLARGEQLALRQAISHYRSQMVVMGDYLLSFDRRNELFVPADVRPVPELAGYDPVDGLPRGGAAVQAPEPNPLRAVEPAVNLRAAVVFQTRRRLWVALSLRGDAAEGAVYRLSLRTVGAAGQARFDLVARRLALQPPYPPGSGFTARRGVAVFSIPLEDLAPAPAGPASGPGVGGPTFVYVSTRAVSDATAVWTPWEMFRLPAGL